jgi:uncharacterized protein
MTIVQAGSVNVAALVVPGVTVQVQPPATQFINGVPTNGLGIVGTAVWGPVNSPVNVGTPAAAQAIFGPLQPRTFDLTTPVNTAAQQGANNFTLVRVTDGTDTAATIEVQTNCISFTSKYTGSFGNQIQVTVAPGAQTGTFQVTVAAPGLVPENYPNIGSGLSGNALWVAIANAINNGNTAFRGPSRIIVATAGAGTTAPASATYTLAGGTDGVTSITTAVMVGVSTAPRTGMFALLNTGVSVAMLSDLSDESSFAAQIAFGLANGIYMVGVSPSGDEIATAVSNKAADGVDSYAFKFLFGDWIFWLDTVNNVQRLVSPQGFAAGFLSALSPQSSPLNKPLQGIIGTQKSMSNQQYAQADLQTLIGAGIDVIANPSPGGAYFSLQSGHNSSSNPIIHGDAYTRMINFLAATFNVGVGQFVGMLDSPTVQASLLASLSAFLDNLASQGMIGNSLGTTPYSVSINAALNPPSQIALGNLQVSVQVQFLAVIEQLLINVQGGSSVQIASVGVSSQTAGTSAQA